MIASTTSVSRVRVSISGVVQGVGFRPLIFNTANELGLVGFVANRGGVVEIELQGHMRLIEQCLVSIQNNPPPGASLESISIVPVPIVPEPEAGFFIEESHLSPAAGASFDMYSVAADAATCKQCLAELFDASNRRFRYPFINCTNCGPRFTIIESLPYDRSTTTMKTFQMCRICLDEYNDPTDRRFHAQPNACSACGPSLWFDDRSSPGSDHGLENDMAPGQGTAEALQAALHALKDGKILAVKGLGGFHLVCDAANASAVSLLRRRKSRPRKPLAIMVKDPDAAKMYCSVSRTEEARLIARDRPIVLLKTSSTCTLPSEVAPGLSEIGVMLPYTPLHHLLLADFGRALIVTSGNISEEPIATDNEEAIERLGRIADAFLFHNRRIYSGYDDSVVRVMKDVQATPDVGSSCLSATARERPDGGLPLVIRRARGMAPLPIKLPFSARTTVLACGAHLKNTFALCRGSRCVMSQHIGDLDSIDSLDHFKHTLSTYERLFQIDPQLVVHDLHPDYISTNIARQIARERGIPIAAVQHHHAHIVSCMIENAIKEPVIGVAFDGIGLGTDDTLWGGEFLLSTYNRFERKAYFRPVPMPGNSQAIKEPWRMALGYLLADEELQDAAVSRYTDELTRNQGRNVVHLIERQIERRLNSPLTSSCGRLFDAVSAIAGVCPSASYEGQAAQELEALLPDPASVPSKGSYGCALVRRDGACVVDSVAIARSALVDVQAGTAPSTMSARFHNTICDTIVTVCSILRQETGIDAVCLSGGVFQNSFLLSLSEQALRRLDFRVYYPRCVPVNDGGISLGQLAIALASRGDIT